MILNPLQASWSHEWIYHNKYFDYIIFYVDYIILFILIFLLLHLILCLWKFLITYPKISITYRTKHWKCRIYYKVSEKNPEFYFQYTHTQNCQLKITHPSVYMLHKSIWWFYFFVCLFALTHTKLNGYKSRDDSERSLKMGLNMIKI